MQMTDTDLLCPGIEMAPPSAAYSLMPCGRFTNVALIDVPFATLAAALDSPNISLSQREIIASVLRFRGLNAGFWKNTPLSEVPAHTLRWYLDHTRSNRYLGLRKLIKRELHERMERQS
jgi:hypothetical protein